MSSIYTNHARLSPARHPSDQLASDFGEIGDDEIRKLPQVGERFCDLPAGDPPFAIDAGLRGCGRPRTDVSCSRCSTAVFPRAVRRRAADHAPPDPRPASIAMPTNAHSRASMALHRTGERPRAATYTTLGSFLRSDQRLRTGTSSWLTPLRPAGESFLDHAGRDRSQVPEIPNYAGRAAATDGVIPEGIVDGDDGSTSPAGVK